MLNFGGFISYLDTLSNNPTTTKTLKSGARRATRDLDDDDLQSVVMVRQYRDSLKQGTRNVFDNVWKYLRAYAGEDAGLAKPERLPYVKYAHPLFADLSFLHGYYGDRIVEQTWADIDGALHADDARRHALRAFEFITGARDPAPTDPIVPKDAARRPMAAWQVRYIVNSEETSGTFDACMFQRDFVSRFSRTDLPASFLRDGCNRIVGARNALSASQMARVRKDVLAAFDAGKYEVVSWLIEQMPQSEDVDLTRNEILW